MIKEIYFKDNEQPTTNFCDKKILIPMIGKSKFDVEELKNKLYLYLDVTEKETMTFICYRKEQFGIYVVKHGFNKQCYWNDEKCL